MIEANHLAYVYPSAKNPVLKGLRFHIKKGEIFGFLGPSGAGKSTTQQFLIGKIKKYSGSAQVLGQEVRSADASFYERIGVAYEFPLKKYSALLRQDLKNGLRDPMLMIIFNGSLLVIAISRYGVPLLSQLLLAMLGIDLQPYNAHITAFLFTLIPLLIGSAAGLLMLDEKDERLVNCYAVTPLRLQGYFMYRLFLPVILCASLLLLFAGVIDNSAAPPALALLLLVLELGAFCISLTAAPWHWLGNWLPAFWPFQFYLSMEYAGNMQIGPIGQGFKRFSRQN